MRVGWVGEGEGEEVRVMGEGDGRERRGGG